MKRKKEEEEEEEEQEVGSLPEVEEEDHTVFMCVVETECS